jgi:hypothetical protein
MDIDTPQHHQQPPQSLRQVAAAGTTAPRGYIGNNQVFRHTFEIEIRNPVPGRMPDLEILRTTRARIRTGVQAPIPPTRLSYPNQRTVRRNLALLIIIDTFSIDRQDALVIADWRLHFMIEMIHDAQGLGWFPGLPWMHDHFQVRVAVQEGDQADQKGASSIVNA